MFVGVRLDALRKCNRDFIVSRYESIHLVCDTCAAAVRGPPGPSPQGPPGPESRQGPPGPESRQRPPGPRRKGLQDPNIACLVRATRTLRPPGP